MNVKGASHLVVTGVSGAFLVLAVLSAVADIFLGALAHRFLLQCLPASVGALVLLETMHAASGPTPPRSVARGRRAHAMAGLKVATVLLVGMFAIGTHAAAQDVTTKAAHRIQNRAVAYTSLQAQLVRGVLSANRDSANALFDEGISRARMLVEEAPADAQAHYLLSVALGYRLEDLGIRKKLEMAREVRTEAERAVELDPGHAGAHHVLGRLNAGAMRLSPISRFMARRIFGGSALSGASWEEAEHQFREAWQNEPTSPRHLMELGAVCIDTDRPELARTYLTQAVALSPTLVIDSLAVVRAKVLLAKLPAK